MKVYGAVLLCFLGISAALSAGQSSYTPPFHTLSPTQKAHILDGQFSIERDVNQLLKEVKLEFARLAGERLQDGKSGEEYQSTDMIMKSRLVRLLPIFSAAPAILRALPFSTDAAAGAYEVASRLKR